MKSNLYLLITYNLLTNNLLPKECGGLEVHTDIRHTSRTQSMLPCSFSESKYFLEDNFSYLESSSFSIFFFSCLLANGAIWHQSSLRVFQVLGPNLTSVNLKNWSKNLSDFASVYNCSFFHQWATVLVPEYFIFPCHFLNLYLSVSYCTYVSLSL